jgi:hypothetical protein
MKACRLEAQCFKTHITESYMPSTITDQCYQILIRNSSNLKTVHIIFRLCVIPSVNKFTRIRCIDLLLLY